jgi:uncharacterized lipoprotein YajG
MSKLLLLSLCFLVGCQGTKNSIETGLSTQLMPDSPVIEKVDVSFKMKREW